MNKPKSERKKIKKTTKKTTSRILTEIAKAEGIISAIGEGINIIDRTFRVIYQNQVHRDMMGDHVGEYCYKAYVKRRGVCVGCPVALTFKNGKVYTVQRDQQTDKGIRYAEITASPLKDSTGKIIAGIEVVRDITERKKIEETLRESEEKFRLSFENAKDAILWANPKTGIIINCNKAAETLLEKPKEEIIGSHRRTLHPPHKLKEYDESFKRHAIQKRPPDVEIEVITKSGKIKTVFVSDTVTFIEGQPIIQGIFHDISEYKKAVKELQKSEERFRAVANSTADLIWERDARNNSLEWFGDIDGFLGYEQGEFPRTISGHLDNVHPEDVNELTKNIKKSIETGEAFRALYRIRCKDGSYRYWDERGKAIEFENGIAIKWAGAISDLTERKRLEEQLFHAKKMESIGTLSGGIANDFNNILTAIIGFGHLLKTEMSEYNPLTIYVTRILSSAERAAILTRSLLAFSRTQLINPRPVDLNEIVKAMKYSLDRFVGSNIEISTVLTDADLTISADTYQIEKVLMNLAENAMDAMQDGGSLMIRTERVELDNKFIKAHGYGKPGPYAFLSIEDSGQGMDEETKARIFEPFFSTKEVGGGSGLGLSVVYGTIKQHEGYINVYSELGKGTTFKIYLPLSKPTAEALKEATPHKINGGIETVLLAVNDAEARDLIKEALKMSGYTVLEADNGEKAVKVFGENREGIQLLILDVLMPKKNGKEVFDEIRKVRPDMKAIFTSGYDIDVIYKKGFLEEEHDFISKPILPDELLRKVREVLDR